MMMRQESSRELPDSISSIGTMSSSERAVENIPPHNYGEKSRKNLPRVVSLFCGAGGLDLGFKEAGFTIALAIDSDEASIRTHRRNFSRTNALTADLGDIGPSGVVGHLLKKVQIGSRIGVIGGPPCQGFSRANTSSRADDPRNHLPRLYLDIVRELQAHYVVEFIVIENVLGIRDKKHVSTYESLLSGIKKLGFNITEEELCSIDFGVPQNRRRIVLSCLKAGGGYSVVKPRKKAGYYTVRQAIGDLEAPAFFRRDLQTTEIPVHPNHWTMMPKSIRFKNPARKDKDGRSFRRLEWDAPSPTIAFGHREIHVHPNGRRRLSIYEALLLQGFPPHFVLEGTLSQQVQQVSNAVPPPLARGVAQAVIRALSRR